MIGMKSLHQGPDNDLLGIRMSSLWKSTAELFPPQGQMLSLFLLHAERSARFALAKYRKLCNCGRLLTTLHDQCCPSVKVTIRLAVPSCCMR